MDQDPDYLDLNHFGGGGAETNPQNLQSQKSEALPVGGVLTPPHPEMMIICFCFRLSSAAAGVLQASGGPPPRYRRRHSPGYTACTSRFYRSAAAAV